MQTANQAWLRLLHEVKTFGTESSPRGQKTLEIVGFQSQIDMQYPCVTVSKRIEGNYLAFMSAEPAWILSGSNRLDELLPFAPSMGRFSDDGRYLRGAYGPKIVDQLGYVVDQLMEDPDTRQAVINIWRENPRKVKDVPCTISVQFLIRDGKLHVVDTMRSSDAWLGWPFDVFSFSMLGAYVILLLRERTKLRGWSDSPFKLQLGTLVLTAGSQHIYERNFSGVDACLASRSHSFEPGPVNPLTLRNPDELIESLREASTGQGGSYLSWLKEKEVDHYREVGMDLNA